MSSMLLAFLQSVVFVALLAALIYVGIYVWHWAHQKCAQARRLRVEAIIGPLHFQKQTLADAVQVVGVPEFQRLLLEGRTIPEAFLFGVDAAYQYMGKRTAWWRAFSFRKVEDPVGALEALEKQVTAIRAENAQLKRESQSFRRNTTAAVSEMGELEDMLLYLLQEQHQPPAAEGDPMPYYGGEIDALRVRMGRAPRRKRFSVDDVIIDVAMLIKWVEGHAELEPPPSFFQLKRALAKPGKSHDA